MKNTLLLCQILVCSALALSGCSPLVQPSPDEIMEQVNLGLANLTSVAYDINLNLEGDIQTNLMSDVESASVRLVGNLITDSTGVPEYELDAQVAAKNPTDSVQVAGRLIGLSDFTYFQLTDLTFPSLLPVSLGVDKKWYRVPSDTTITAGSVAQESESDTASSVNEILTSSTPITITEVLPITTLGGKRVYHYKSIIDPEQLSNLLGQLATVIDPQLSVPDLNSLADYRPEIFVSTKTHQLVGIRVSDTISSPSIDMDLEVILSDHNRRLTIDPPSSSENIDSGKVFGFPKLPF